jgi:RimJ/RimL family protein N-acetyltransferase
MSCGVLLRTVVAVLGCHLPALNRGPHRAAGGTKEELKRLAEAAPVWTPDAQPWPEIISFDVLDLPDFPTHILPDSLRRWVKAESHGTQTPADLAALNPFHAEIGYWLAKPYWGQGIMTDVVRLACDFALAEWKRVRIIAHVFDFNRASARVPEKNGFEFEGLLRKHHRKDGALLNSRLYTLVKQKTDCRARNCGWTRLRTSRQPRKMRPTG